MKEGIGWPRDTVHDSLGPACCGGLQGRCPRSPAQMPLRLRGRGGALPRKGGCTARLSHALSPAHLPALSEQEPGHGVPCGMGHTEASLGPPARHVGAGRLLGQEQEVQLLGSGICPQGWCLARPGAPLCWPPRAPSLGAPTLQASLPTQWAWPHTGGSHPAFLFRCLAWTSSGLHSVQ